MLNLLIKPLCKQAQNSVSMILFRNTEVINVNETVENLDVTE